MFLEIKYLRFNLFLYKELILIYDKIMELSIEDIVENYKKCHKCSQIKPKTDFYNRRGECKICRKSISNSYYKNKNILFLNYKFL